MWYEIQELRLHVHICVHVNVSFWAECSGSVRVMGVFTVEIQCAPFESSWVWVRSTGNGDTWRHTLVKTSTCVVYQLSCESLTLIVRCTGVCRSAHCEHTHKCELNMNMDVNGHPYLSHLQQRRDHKGLGPKSFTRSCHKMLIRDHDRRFVGFKNLALTLECGKHLYSLFIQVQTCQVSRIWCETHAFACHLILTRICFMISLIQPYRVKAC